MLTYTNMIQAAKANIHEWTQVYTGSATAYLAALNAVQFANMALGAVQEPFDQERVDEAARLDREARKLLQATIEAQLEDAAKRALRRAG